MVQEDWLKPDTTLMVRLKRDTTSIDGPAEAGHYIDGADVQLKPHTTSTDGPAKAGHYTYTRVARNSSRRVSRARVRSGPSHTSNSNSPGLIVRPVTATRVA